MRAELEPDKLAISAQSMPEAVSQLVIPSAIVDLWLAESAVQNIEAGVRF